MDEVDPLDLAWPELANAFGLKGSETFPSGNSKEVSNETLEILKSEGIAEKSCALVQGNGIITSNES